MKITAQGGRARIMDKPDPAASPATAPAPAPAAKKDEDWWEDFRRAVEDPDVSIYEYLRDNALRSMDLDNKAGLSESVVQARQVALRELFALTDPEELAKKLKALEKNALLFNPQARAMMKVTRAVLETYVKTRDETKKGQPASDDMGAAIGERLKEELAATGVDEEINPALESVARSLKDKDEKEVTETIRKAAEQMAEDRNVLAMIRDAAIFTRRYLKPDNIVNIAIIALPLITWQYRWALALGLGAWAGRHTVAHGAKAVTALYRGDRAEARKQGQESLKSLKAAGSSVLLVSLSPVLAKYPALMAGFLGFAIEAAYNTTLDTFNKMLAEEEKKPGTTPLGRRLRAGVKTFFKTYQDTIARLSVRTLKTMVPHAVTVAAEEISKRLPLSKLRVMAGRTWMISGALATRFNRVARARVGAAAQEMEALRQDVVALGRDFMRSAEKVMQDVSDAATRRENERLAALILLAERARAIEAAEQEEAARLAAEKAAPANENSAEAAPDFTRAAEAEAAQKRKRESMARHQPRTETDTARRAMTARAGAKGRDDKGPENNLS